MKILPKTKRNGSVLALVICILAILLVLGVGLLSLGLNSRIVATRDASAVLARTAADAGLQKALHMLDANLMDYQTGATTTLQAWTGQSPTYDMSTSENCKATYTYSVYPDANYPASQWVYDVTSTGISKIDGTSKTIKAILNPLSWAAVHGLDLTGNGSVSGETKGTVGSDESSIGLVVRTQSYQPDAIDFGTALPGTELLTGYNSSNPNYDPTTVIESGNFSSVTAAKAPILFPPPKMPDGITWTYKGTIDVTTTNLTTTIGSAGNTVYYKYDQIKFENQGDNLAISGNVNLFITPPITTDPPTLAIEFVKEGSQIILNPNSTLTIYTAGDIQLQNGITMNGTTDCLRLQIYGYPPPPMEGYIAGSPGCTSIVNKNQGSFIGTIYAPQAAVSFKNSGDYNGALTAYSLEMKNPASNFIWAASLLYKKQGLSGSKNFAVTYWHEQ